MLLITELKRAQKAAQVSNRCLENTAEYCERIMKIAVTVKHYLVVSVVCEMLKFIWEAKFTASSNSS